MKKKKLRLSGTAALEICINELNRNSRYIFWERIFRVCQIGLGLFDILPMSKARGFYPLRHRDCASMELLGKNVTSIQLVIHLNQPIRIQQIRVANIGVADIMPHQILQFFFSHQTDAGKNGGIVSSQQISYF